MRLQNLWELDGQTIFRAQKAKCGGPLFISPNSCQVESRVTQLLREFYLHLHERKVLDLEEHGCQQIED